MTLVEAKHVRELLDYDPDTGLFAWRERGPKWFKSANKAPAWNARYAGAPALTARMRQYLGGLIFKKAVLAHRVAWAHVHNEWPRHQIDHIDGDRTNNRIENLRCVTNRENHRNRKLPTTNTSGFIGVSFVKRTGKWSAAIKVDSKTISLGHYSTIEEAAAARKRADKTFGYHPNHGRQSAKGEAET